MIKKKRRKRKSDKQNLEDLMEWNG
jgi:hypothetical protein